jgi:hypothetical protein
MDIGGAICFLTLGLMLLGGGIWAVVRVIQMRAEQGRLNAARPSVEDASAADEAENRRKGSP